MAPEQLFRNNRLKNNHLRLDDLSISFRRTIRVPDGNRQASNLPPDEGKFPLFQVAEYSTDEMPPEMAAKGGLFMPIHDQEAMWIKFSSENPYAIKIFVGGVNAISGEPAVETPASRLRKAKRLAEGKSLQDYVVVPGQLWIDGFATRVGLVRQFVATPMGSGYSVEKQILGEENVGGLRMEITPLKERVLVKMRNGLVITVWGAKIKGTAGEVKALLVGRRGWCPEDKEADVALWLDDSELRDMDVLALEWVEDGDLLVPRRKTRSTGVQTRQDGKHHVKDELPIRTKEAKAGSSGKARKLQQNPSLATTKRMNVAAAGAIYQRIMRDPYMPRLPFSSNNEIDTDAQSATVTGAEVDIDNPWDYTKTVRFNIHLLNAASFTAITGLVPHPSPFIAAKYAEMGYPFFKMPAGERETDVYGDFGNMKSIAQMQDVEEDEVYPEVWEVGTKTVLPLNYHDDVILDPKTFFERCRL